MRIVSIVLPALILGCAATTPRSNLTLEVTASADVGTLDIGIRDGDGREVGHRLVRVARSLDALATRPERIELEVPLGAIQVHLRDASTGLAASRCYDVTGPLVDDVHLVVLDALLDVDGDGWVSDGGVLCRDRGADGSAVGCDVGACPSAAVADCDDDDPERFPGAPYYCGNGLDENCFDEGLPGGDEPCDDRDGDGYQACSATGVPGTCDCRDDDPESFPGAEEGCGEGRDRDCDGRITACDADGDGFTDAEDCDETDADVHPGATEVCDDGVDQDCNDRIDDGPDCVVPDMDFDGFDRCEGARDCSSCDCDDCNGGVFPGADEVCDGIDQETGEPVPASGDPFPDCPGDRDGDGAIGGLDCDEGDGETYVGAAENCDTPRLEGCVAPTICDGEDADGDGYVMPEDCDDGDAALHPGASEACNGRDDDCDGILDEVTASGIGCVHDSASCGSATSCTVELDSNDLHCGGCGIRCAEDESCFAGSCVG